MAESAFMIEPLSDSMEEDIFPVSRRSVGLKRRERGFSKREREREKGETGNICRTHSES
jgi:hypothetical protein